MKKLLYLLLDGPRLRDGCDVTHSHHHASHLLPHLFPVKIALLSLHHGKESTALPVECEKAPWYIVAWFNFVSTQHFMTKSPFSITTQLPLHNFYHEQNYNYHQVFICFLFIVLFIIILIYAIISNLQTIQKRNKTHSHPCFITHTYKHTHYNNFLHQFSLPLVYTLHHNCNLCHYFQLTDCPEKK